MASQNGYISNEQLDAFHPKAALEHRKEATRLEEAALKKHGAEKKIKAHLDTAFTNMGIKGNEKSPAYVEAMENAKADYARQYNKYVSQKNTKKILVKVIFQNQNLILLIYLLHLIDQIVLV